jgi:hypothetical protein
MPKRPRETQFWESAKINNQSYIQYYNRLMGLCIGMFEWKNLPDTVDERFLELALYATGQAVFFKDDAMDAYLALRCMIGGRWNLYNIPTERTAYATNGYFNRLDDSNSVIIYNNEIRTNSMLDVELYSRRLYNLDRAVDVNANAQKTPLLILCDDTQRLTMKNMYMQYDGNQPVIYGTKSGLAPDSIKAVNTGAPYVADKLYSLKEQIWNEALTTLGVLNVNFEKKERMTTYEVVRNSGETMANRYSRLNARRQACEQINKMFGLDIWCDYREDITMAQSNLYGNTEMQGLDNSQVVEDGGGNNE